MTNRDFSDPRATEQRNRRPERIDVASSLEIVDLMNGEDATVAKVVHGERERVAAAIELIVAAFRAGGRLVYVGAGTSGRLGGRDATQGPSSPPRRARRDRVSTAVWRPADAGGGRDRRRVSGARQKR